MRTKRLKIVRSKCRELIRELGLYIYDATKPEQEEPIKKDDHAPTLFATSSLGMTAGKRCLTLGEERAISNGKQEKERSPSRLRCQASRRPRGPSQHNG